MSVRDRVDGFCVRYGLRMPILTAPMAGACPPELSIAVAEAGGMGAAGVVLDGPERIADWMQRFRAGTAGPVQLNTWIPDPPDDERGDDALRVAAATGLLARLGTPGAEPRPAPDFAAQCTAMIDARPTVVSSIMGRFDDDYVRRLRDAGIAWFAVANTLDAALAAQDAGADAVVAQGMEAGGHRGTRYPAAAETTDIGLFALVPRLADRLDVPVIATGGIADGRGVAAALTLGASAVQIGTALLRSPEAGIDERWSAALADLDPEDTTPTRAYSGRLGRAVRTPYVAEWEVAGAPRPAPHPIQRRLVAQWRAGEPGGVDRVNFWSGQSAALARVAPAGDIVRTIWEDAQALLP